MVAPLLNCHPWFLGLSRLPFNKKPCEGMLRRVVAKLVHYLHMDRFEQVNDLFVLVKPPVMVR